MQNTIDKTTICKKTASVFDVLDKFIDAYRLNKEFSPKRIVISNEQLETLKREAERNPSFHSIMKDGIYKGVKLERVG